jgi:hypothetical protein
MKKMLTLENRNKGWFLIFILYFRRVHSLKVRLSDCGPVLALPIGRAVFHQHSRSNYIF